VQDQNPGRRSSCAVADAALGSALDCDLEAIEKIVTVSDWHPTGIIT
jgi:hypothetical protein